MIEEYYQNFMTHTFANAAQFKQMRVFYLQCGIHHHGQTGKLTLSDKMPLNVCSPFYPTVRQLSVYFIMYYTTIQLHR